MYRDKAWIVGVGFTDPEVTNQLPSTIYIFSISCSLPYLFVTEFFGLSPILAVPIKCHPAYLINGVSNILLAPASNNISLDFPDIVKEFENIFKKEHKKSNIKRFEMGYIDEK